MDVQTRKNVKAIGQNGTKKEVSHDCCLVVRLLVAYIA